MAGASTDSAGGGRLALVAVAGAVVAFTLAASTLGAAIDTGSPIEGGDATVSNGSAGEQSGEQKYLDNSGTADRGGGFLSWLPTSLVPESLPRLLPLVGIALLGGAVLVVVVVSTGDAATPPDTEPSRDQDGRSLSADEPADRTRSLDVPVTNGVYRAWDRFRDRGATDDEATVTPTERARRRQQPGTREPVERLLETFQRVRYRGDQPTAEREQAAQRALRRIERTDAEQDDETDTPATDDSRGDE